KQRRWLHFSKPCIRLGSLPLATPRLARPKRRALLRNNARMPLPVQGALQSWTTPVPLTLAIALTAFLYLRGWLYLRSRSVNIIPTWRAGSFVLGLFLIWIALGSP